MLHDMLEISIVLQQFLELLALSFILLELFILPEQVIDYFQIYLKKTEVRFDIWREKLLFIEFHLTKDKFIL